MLFHQLFIPLPNNNNDIHNITCHHEDKPGSPHTPRWKKQLVANVDIIPASTGITQSPQNNKAIITQTQSTLCITLPSQQHDFLSVPLATKAGSSSSPGPSSSPSPSPSKPCQASTLSAQLADPSHKDCLLREFRKLCATVSERNSYNDKTTVIEKFLRKGSVGGECRGYV